jgi:hypothetical protein
MIKKNKINWFHIFLRLSVASLIPISLAVGFMGLGCVVFFMMNHGTFLGLVVFFAYSLFVHYGMKYHVRFVQFCELKVERLIQKTGDTK